MLAASRPHSILSLSQRLCLPRGANRSAVSGKYVTIKMERRVNLHASITMSQLRLYSLAYSYAAPRADSPHEDEHSIFGPSPLVYFL